MDEIRRANLQAVIKEWDGPTKLANKLGYRNPAFLVQIAGPNPTRALTERKARQFEVKLGLPERWFDTNKDHRPSQIDEAKLRSVAQLVATHAHSAGITLSPDKFADLVILGYENETLIKRVITLLK